MRLGGDWLCLQWKSVRKTNFLTLTSSPIFHPLSFLRYTDNVDHKLTNLACRSCRSCCQRWDPASSRFSSQQVKNRDVEERNRALPLSDKKDICRWRPTPRMGILFRIRFASWQEKVKQHTSQKSSIGWRFFNFLSLCPNKTSPWSNLHRRL